MPVPSASSQPQSTAALLCAKRSEACGLVGRRRLHSAPHWCWRRSSRWSIPSSSRVCARVCVLSQPRVHDGQWRVLVGQSISERAERVCVFVCTCESARVLFHESHTHTNTHTHKHTHAHTRESNRRILELPFKCIQFPVALTTNRACIPVPVTQLVTHERP